ncbi:MAG: sodium-translocating pyrophosphatase, partial [Clostridia bacterium]|nr:sodium-translocating pyrophosphatase [Clostridia bacterium]
MNFVKRLLNAKTLLMSALAVFLVAGASFAGEADLIVPDLKTDPFQYNLLLVGIVISALGLIFGLFEYSKVKRIKAHKSMTDIGNLIFETCKTYLVQ